jgi:GGDEF domain-containing protein
LSCLGDIDGLNKVNRQHNFEIGTSFLNGLLKILREILPQDAIIARDGGDEFAIIVSRNSLRTHLSEFYASHSKSTFYGEILNPEELSIKRAFQSVYAESKKQGTPIEPSEITITDTVLQFYNRCLNTILKSNALYTKRSYN